MPKICGCLTLALANLNSGMTLHDPYLGNYLPIWDRNINYVPGFFKIFDEILVNAADNKVSERCDNEKEL